MELITPRMASSNAGGLDDQVYNRLLKERIIFLASVVEDSMANAIAAQMLLLAAEDPETEPKIPHPNIVVCIKRPGTLFSQGLNPSNISSDNRVLKRISPIQMKSGNAASSQLALLSQKAENRFFPGWVDVKKYCPTHPTIASAIAIQTPANNRANNEISKNTPRIQVSICMPQRSEEKSPLACLSRTART